MTPDGKTVNIKQACELCGVTRRTIYNWMARGQVSYILTASGRRRIYADTLWRRGGPIWDDPDSVSDKPASAGAKDGA